MGTFRRWLVASFSVWALGCGGDDRSRRDGAVAEDGGAPSDGSALPDGAAMDGGTGPSEDDLLWARRFGGAGGHDGAVHAAGRSDGSFVVTGTFRGRVAFGETGEGALESVGSADVFVAAYDGSGALLWAKRAGGPGVDEPAHVLALEDGSVIVTGRFHGSAIFGSGEARETRLECVSAECDMDEESADGFVARFGADGALAWAYAPGGGIVSGAALVGDDIVVPVDADDGITLQHLSRAGEERSSTLFATGGAVTAIVAWDDGSIALAGYFRSETLLPGHADELPGAEYMLVRLAADGSLIWAEATMNIQFQSQWPIAALPDGSLLFAAGLERGTRSDFHLARFGPDGTAQWSKTAMGDYFVWVRSVAVTGDGEVLVSGESLRRLTLGAGEATETDLSGTVFVARFTGEGALLNVAAASSSDPQAESLAVLPDGSAVMAGSHHDDLVLGDPAAGVGVPDPETRDVLLARVASDGTWSWAIGRGSDDGYDSAYDLEARADGSVRLAGTLRTSSVLGEGEPGETTIDSNGAGDAFVAELDSDGALAWVLQVGGAGHDIAVTLSSAADGSFAVGGRIGGEVVFDEGVSLAPADESDGFVAVYEADRTLRWARRIGGEETYDVVTDLHLREDGSVLVLGRNGTSTTVDGSGATFSEQGMFLVEYGSDGVALRARQLCTGIAFGPRLALLDGGELGVVAAHRGLACDAGLPSETRLAADRTNGLVLRLRADGAIGWARDISNLSTWGMGLGYALAVTTGPGGLLVVAGTPDARNSAVLADGTELTMLVERFLLGFAGDGSIEWHQPAGGSVMDLAVTESGTILATGTVGHIATLFIAEHEANGELVRSRDFPSRGAHGATLIYGTAGLAIVPLPSAELAIAGHLQGALTLSPSTTLTAPGDATDVMVARLRR